MALVQPITAMPLQWHDTCDGHRTAVVEYTASTGELKLLVAHVERCDDGVNYSVSLAPSLETIRGMPCGVVPTSCMIHAHMHRVRWLRLAESHCEVLITQLVMANRTAPAERDELVRDLNPHDLHASGRLVH